MKTLKESILRRPEKGRVAVEQIIIDWLETNTRIFGEYTINNDLTIDVKGTLTITNKSIKEIPSIINFGKCKFSKNARETIPPCASRLNKLPHLPIA